MKLLTIMICLFIKRDYIKKRCMTFFKTLPMKELHHKVPEEYSSARSVR